MDPPFATNSRMLARTRSASVYSQSMPAPQLKKMMSNSAIAAGLRRNVSVLSGGVLTIDLGVLEAHSTDDVFNVVVVPCHHSNVRRLEHALIRRNLGHPAAHGDIEARLKACP